MNKNGPPVAAEPQTFGTLHYVAASVAGLAILYLIFGLPYAAGYAHYRQTLSHWLGTAWKDATWQHGALAPLIAGFLIWRRRAVLKKTPLKGSVIGGLLVLMSLFGFWVGYRGNFYFIGYTSLQVLCAGVVIWLFGFKFFKEISFAWVMLAFTWPYLFLENTLAFQLRVLMVDTTATFLNLVGVPTHQDGTRLVSAATETMKVGEIYDLNVDGPCSGLRSLFALMMVSTLFSYYRQRTWWRRLLLMAFSFPLAVLANMMRLMILIAATLLFGQEFAIGRGEEYTSNFHLLAGIFVYFIALGGLLVVDKLIHRIFGKEKPLKLLDS